MKRQLTLRSIVTLALVSASAAGLHAATIVGVGANSGSSFGVGGSTSQVETMSWTQTSTFTGESISALVGSTDGSSRSVSAYLTTAVGPGAPAPIATTTFTVPSFANSGAITLASIFSGLTLGPGSYYLTLFNSDTSGNTIIRWAQAPDTYPLASANGELFANSTNGTPNTTNPWQSTFITSTGPALGFQVTGTAVPEPATLSIVSGALAAFAVFVRRRK